MKANAKNVIEFPPVYNQPFFDGTAVLDKANRIRRARYETKKLALTVSPSTVFNLEVIKFH